MRPKRRSLLMVPALQERFYERALSSGADTIIFDLEDSVAAGAKATARERLRALFPATAYQELAIRINHPATEWYAADLELLAELRPAAVVLPKTETVAEILALAAVLEASSPAAEILVYIESLAGYFNAAALLTASPRVTAVLLGAEDLTAELGVQRGDATQQPLLRHMQVELALRARMLGLQCIGAIHRGYGSSEHLARMEQESRALKELAVTGRVAIHPSQVPLCNAIYGLSMQEIQQARRVLELFTEVSRSGSAVIRQNQQMEDLPSLKRAEEILALARDYGYILD